MIFGVTKPTFRLEKKPLFLVSVSISVVAETLVTSPPKLGIFIAQNHMYRTWVS